ncbi:MAG: thermonuclease family protein [bacterium]|nr:thermonuclease family protein [bacterium]
MYHTLIKNGSHTIIDNSIIKILYIKKVSFFNVVVMSSAILLSFFLLPHTSNAETRSDLVGKILLQVQSKGEAWYVNPADKKRYYLGRPADAFGVMRTLGVGISEKNMSAIFVSDKTNFKMLSLPHGKALLGKIILRVEKNGEAYYIEPTTGYAYFLGRPKDAFDVMRGRGLGISNTDLDTISSASFVGDESYTYYTVSNVTDGDTIKVGIDGTLQTVRMIGMDTPETVDPRVTVQCFGVEASNKAKELLLGKKIRIEKDTSQNERDIYGRLLGYVYREDGLFFNKYMIEQGYAHEYTYIIPYTYQAEFKDAEKVAKENEKGLWSPSACDGDTTSSVPSSVLDSPSSDPDTSVTSSIQ